MRNKVLLFVLLLMMPSLSSLAFDVEIDGIYYNIISKGNVAEVTYAANVKYSGAVEIPASIMYNGEEYPVVAIGEYAFESCHSLKYVSIPKSVTEIGEEAFNK